MQPGQIGRTEFRWIALSAAILLTAACQSTASLDGSHTSSNAATRTNAQPAAAIPKDTASFIGLDDGALSRTLGQPQQVRKDAPAEIWQYAGANCVVDFYLYTGDSGGLAVAYMEARDRAAEATPADRCVRSLLQSVSVATQQQTL
jgi:hypothetical protein